MPKKNGNKKLEDFNKNFAKVKVCQEALADFNKTFISECTQVGRKITNDYSKNIGIASSVVKSVVERHQL